MVLIVLLLFCLSLGLLSLDTCTRVLKGWNVVWSGMFTSCGCHGAPTFMPKELLLLCSDHSTSMEACAPAATDKMAGLYHVWRHHPQQTPRVWRKTWSSSHHPFLPLQVHYHPVSLAYPAKNCTNFYSKRTTTTLQLSFHINGGLGRQWDASDHDLLGHKEYNIQRSQSELGCWIELLVFFLLLLVQCH